VLFTSAASMGGSLKVKVVLVPSNLLFTTLDTGWFASTSIVDRARDTSFFCLSDGGVPSYVSM